MRAWPVPIQITDEERLIGGKLTLRQLGYIVAGLALGGASFGFTFLPLLARFTLFFLVAGGGFTFAYAWIYHMRVDQYLYLYFKWRRSPRFLFLKGGN